MGYRPLRFCRVTQLFGAPGSYASRANQWGPAGHHTGLDFGRALNFPSLLGAKVRSSTPGTVVISEFNDTMGNWVGVYYAADDVTITYWHLKGRAVSVGDVVDEGTLLGRAGSTGNSTGPHLHVQVNPGRGFDYHAHIPPAPWCRGEDWAGQPKKKEAR